MNVLQSFLIENPVENIEQEIDIGGRLAGKPFKIKAITGGKFTDFQTICMENIANPKKRFFQYEKNSMNLL